MRGYLDYGIPASRNLSNRRWTKWGVARDRAGLRSPLSLSVYRGALEHPLILYRLEKPKIKKKHA